MIQKKLPSSLALLVNVSLKWTNNWNKSLSIVNGGLFKCLPIFLDQPSGRRYFFSNLENIELVSLLKYHDEFEHLASSWEDSTEAHAAATGLDVRDDGELSADSFVISFLLISDKFKSSKLETMSLEVFKSDCLVLLLWSFE